MCVCVCLRFVRVCQLCEVCGERECVCVREVYVCARAPFDGDDVRRLMERCGKTRRNGDDS